jgi:hypothetical protein
MTAPTADASSAGLLERLGWRAERRPEPGFAHTLGAAAAAFLVFATLALIGEITGDDPTLPGVGLNLVLLAAGVVIGMQIAGPVRSACVTLIVLTVPLIWFFLFLEDGGSTGKARGFYLLVLGSYAVFYLLVWTKGRGIFLGLVLLLLVSWVVWEVGSADRGPVPFQDQVTSTIDSPFGDSGSFSSDDNTDETAAVALVFGLVYLGAAAALDRKKLTGSATPFIAVGLVATIAGSIVLVRDSSATAGGLTLAASGAIVGLVGGLGRDRRFSTWFGVLLVVIGLSIVVADVVDSNLGAAGFFAVLALAVAAVANFAAPKLDEFVDGDINAGKTSDSA